MPKSVYSEDELKALEEGAQYLKEHPDLPVGPTAHELAEKLGRNERGISLWLGRRKAYLLGIASKGRRGRPPKRANDPFQRLTQLAAEWEDLQRERAELDEKVQAIEAERNQIMTVINEKIPTGFKIVKEEN